MMEVKTKDRILYIFFFVVRSHSGDERLFSRNMLLYSLTLTGESDESYSVATHTHTKKRTEEWQLYARSVASHNSQFLISFFVSLAQCEYNESFPDINYVGGHCRFSRTMESEKIVEVTRCGGISAAALAYDNRSASQFQEIQQNECVSMARDQLVLALRIHNDCNNNRI